MKITVNRDARTAALTGRWAAHEATPVTLAGIAGAHADTLRLALFTTAGTLLAACDAWTAELAGTLDTRTTPVSTFFAGRRPDESMVVIMALADQAELYVLQSADMVNNPLATAPVAPDPAPRYLVSRDFAALVALPADATGDQLAAALASLIAKLKDPDQ